MKTLYRKKLHKGKSARKFKHHVKQAKGLNFAVPMRGGFRI